MALKLMRLSQSIDSSRPRRSGFSLIELLIAIVILAALAALAAPGYRLAVESANRTKCQSQMRQVFMGLGTYAADHRGFVPSVRNTNLLDAVYAEPTLNDHTYGALLLLYPNYVSSKDLFVCPSDRDPAKAVWLENEKQGLYTSYFAYRDLNTEGEYRRLWESDPNFGANLPLMGDAAKTNFHRTGYNVCFADGHIEYVPASKFQVQPYVNFFWE